MNSSSDISTGRPPGKKLSFEPLYGLYGILASWRKEQESQEEGTRRVKKDIFSFVKGLRLQAQLIYTIREVLSPYSDIKVDWGQLLDKNGIACSPECDIIIHRTGHIRNWNGSKDPIMDFKFIDCRQAIVVISCKSFMDRIKRKDSMYCEKVKKYVDQVWLFAECCKPKAAANLKQKAFLAGYNKFWYLYSWDRKKSITINDERVWLDFLYSLHKSGKKRFIKE